MKIHSVKKEDRGTYFCVADNGEQCDDGDGDDDSDVDGDGGDDDDDDVGDDDDGGGDGALSEGTHDQ